MNHFLKFLLILLVFQACHKTENVKEISPGLWRGILDVQGQELPFSFTLVKKDSVLYAYLHNGEESIELDEIYVIGDSLIMNMHIFDSDIRARINEGQLSGFWQKQYIKDYKVPFTAFYNDSTRFPVGKPISDFSGKWKVKFSDEKVDSVFSVGVFEQNSDGKVLGTFLNATGDYRTLEGSTIGNTMRLSTFDGGHAFLFTGSISGDSTIAGDFWSGSHSYETWTGQRDELARIPDEYKLTFLKEGYDSIFFTFPDTEGKLTSLDDKKFRNKIIILQLFGTWCPNCMDETRFLSQWYSNNKDKEVEVIGLAYEARDDFDYARARVKKMKEKLSVEYDFLIAGIKDKDEAAKTLPMLNHIMAFPTTIFIDRKGKVRRIHTGFTGPGTGKYYDEFVTDFEEFTEKLILE